MNIIIGFIGFICGIFITIMIYFIYDKIKNDNKDKIEEIKRYNQLKNQYDNFLIDLKEVSNQLEYEIKSLKKAKSL
jgi:hypothetical protein